MFRTFKTGVKEKFRSSPSAMQAIVFLLKQIDRRHREKKLFVDGKRLRIFSLDPEIRTSNYEASDVLNERGARLWNSVQESAKKADEDGTVKVVDDEGVEESFITGEKKVYETDASSCSCSFFLNNRLVCRHILLLRKEQKLPLFSRDLFDRRWWRQSPEDKENDHEDGHNGEGEGLTSVQDTDDMAQVEDSVEDGDTRDKQEVVDALDGIDKFRIVRPLLDQISELLAAHSTKKFGEYVEEMKLVECRIRNGESIFKSEEAGVEKENKNEDKDKYSDLRFKPKLKTVGRPKGSTRHCSFNKRKGIRASKAKKRFNVKRAGKGASMGDAAKNPSNVKTDEENIGEHSNLSKKVPKEMPTIVSNIVCTYPPNTKKNAIYVRDYITLAPRQCVMDVVVDFKLRTIQPDGPADQEVFVLGIQLSQLIAQNWWSSPTLAGMVRSARMWQENGCKVMVVPWCESHHYFLLVAVLEPQPLLFILESIGRYPQPSGAEVVRNFLIELRVSVGGPRVPFKTFTPPVPRQEALSNDCGLFALEYAEKIVQDPDEFVRKARLNDLSDWFDSDTVSVKRKELAELLRQLGEEQRQPGGVLESEGPLYLPSFSSIPLLKRSASVKLPEVNPKKMRKCGICCQSGHTRAKCPVKNHILDEVYGDDEYFNC